MVDNTVAQTSGDSGGDVRPVEVLDHIRDLIDDDSRYEASEFRDETRVILDTEYILDVCESLKQTEPYYFLHLSDITAVDYPERSGPRFDVVYQLYSFNLNMRIRLKVQVDEDESVPSLTELWSTANWLEREVYDMFGITFSGHPNLERILMPKATQSHPLRKDYPLNPRKDFQERRPEVAQEAEEWEVDYEHHPR